MSEKKKKRNRRETVWVVQPDHKANFEKGLDGSFGWIRSLDQFKSDRIGSSDQFEFDPDEASWPEG